MKKLIKRYPALAAALLSLVGAVIGIFIEDPTLTTALVGVLAACLGIHHVTVPVTTMVEKVTNATTTAATEVARNLDNTTAGVAGEVANGANEVVETVIDLTLGKVLTIKQRNGEEK